MTDAPPPKRIVVATAGHVDHGKTALIRALTGVDTDRLPEEKARGISIELGFAELAGAGAGVSFIDVPGHERLVHTMIAGVGGVDALLLVVAADDGVMPQTREHLAVGYLLGVQRVLVALSKCELGDPETLELAEAEVREELARFGLEPLAVVRTSATTGEGIRELERQLIDLAAQAPARPESARAWLSVDRVFSLRGVGTVVTGTLTRGILREGETIYVATEKGVVESACRSIEVHGQRLREVRAPTRLAINLARLSTDEISRGDVISKDRELPLSRRLDVAVRWLPGILEKLSPRKRVIVHLGTTRAEAKVVKLGENTAHLALDRALPCEGGLNLVLRGMTARRDFGRVLGGGRVLDAGAAARPRTRDRDSLRLRAEFLEELCRGNTRAGLVGLLRAQAPRPIVEADVERRFGFEPGTVASLLDGERAQGLVVRLGDKQLSDQQSWTTREGMALLVEAAVAGLERYHTDTPDELGAPLETVRATLSRRGGRQAAFDAIELALQSGRLLAVEGGRVCLPEFAEQSRSTRDDASERVRATLTALGLEGAHERQVAERAGLPVERTRAALTGLAKAGEARRLSDLWFAERELSELRARVYAHFDGHPTLDVAAFKELTRVSRKQAIPLLEHFDHEGVTRRQGDHRVRGPATR